MNNMKNMNRSVLRAGWFILLFITLMSGASALNSYVTLTIQSLKDASNEEIALSMFDDLDLTHNRVQYYYCIDTSCWQVPTDQDWADEYSAFSACLDSMDEEYTDCWAVLSEQEGSLFKKGWSRTQGPFPGWASGSVHEVSITFEGDVGCDIRMYNADGRTPRAWSLGRINSQECPLDAGTSDLGICGSDQFFAAGSDADGSATAGFGDINSCADEKFAWRFFFSV
ncbi:MAG: hypothetical protein V1743_07885 [Nanoarchaeota archaeon]